MIMVMVLAVVVVGQRMTGRVITVGQRVRFDAQQTGGVLMRCSAADQLWHLQRQPVDT